VREAVEGCEETLHVRRSDPGSGVGDVDPEPVVSELGIERDRSGLSVVFHGVREQVEEHLLEPLPVGHDVRSVDVGRQVDRDTLVGRERFDQLHSLPEGVNDAHGLRR
jgi:hypothetical protein